MDANVLAHLVIMVWIPLGIFLASTMERRKAFLIIFFGGIMYLPEKLRFDFPLLPPFDKHSITALAAWIGCLIVAKKPEDANLKSTAVRTIAFLSCVGAFGTALTNGDSFNIGGTYLQSMSPMDGVGSTIRALISPVLPFLLGWMLFRTPADIRVLLRTLVFACVLYVPLALLEARLSPQLHIWTYGYFQHGWGQMKRDGGYRAIVYMGHALELFLLMSQAVIASAGLWRLKDKGLPLPIGVAFFLVLVGLVSGKSSASITYALLFAPLVVLSPPGLQLVIARVLAIFVILYPVLSLYGVIDFNWILDKTMVLFGPERTESMGFRFMNEQMLLDRASERLWFGWGGYGRARVYSPETGEDLTTVDGEWISSLGNRGFFGFLLTFLIFLLPIFQANRSRRFVTNPDDARVLSLVAVLLAITGVDVIPNARSHDLSVLLAGALTGTCTQLKMNWKRQRAHPHAHRMHPGFRSIPPRPTAAPARAS